MKQVKSTVSGAQDMNGDVRHYVESNADNIFDRLTKEKK